MTFETFIQSFLIIIILGTLTVTGWFFITRGYEQLMEDGSIYRYGKIFKAWYFFWTKKKKEKERVYFDNAHLMTLYYEIRKKFQYNAQVSGKKPFAIWVDGDEMYIDIFTITDYIEKIREIENDNKIKFFDIGTGQYKVYKEYDQYVYPEWIRDPLAACATCFSSIYGTAFYWLLIALCDVNLFAWSSYPVLASVFFWISFCFCLSVINTAIAKKYN